MKQYVDFKDVNLNDNLVLSIKESGKTVTAIKASEKVGKIFFSTITYVFLIVLAFFVIFPFYWMIITSLKTLEEITASTQTFFPTTVMWTNYVYIFQRFDFSKYMVNTIIVAIISTAGTLITTIFAAFAFSRFQFKGRETVFMIFLMTMMIPGEMMVISNYITVASFGWIDKIHQTMWQAYAFAKMEFKGKSILFAVLLGSMMIPGEMMVITNFISVSRLGWLSDESVIGRFAAMIVPFWVSIFYIYLLRQNFKQIPNELYLAAKVDGKSDWQYLWKVMVPLAMPTLTTIFILKLMGAWNSYVWPQLITGSRKQLWLITNGLRESFTAADDVNMFGAQMAATVIVTVPLLFLFIFFRKYIMRGVGRAGIKG